MKGSKVSSEETFETTKKILMAEFGIEEPSIVRTALMADDLDLDSIDAIDLAIRLEDETGLQLAEEDLKSVRTLDDFLARLRPSAERSAS